MEIPKPVRVAAALACAFQVVSSSGSRPGLTGFRGALFKLLAALHLAKLASQRRFVRLALYAMALVQFEPQPGAAKLNAIQYVFRRLLWGKAGLNMPPSVPLWLALRNARKFGPWQRHLSENAMAKELGPAYTIIRPFSSTSWAPAVPVVFVSDPSAVRQVMSDKKTFNTRGHTGFSLHTAEGLLGLPTGPTWAQHRRIMTQFLSENHLRAYAPLIQEQVEVLLRKWESAAANSRAVNVYYDMSMLTLDVIMSVSMGERNELAAQQLVEEKDNHMARDLDLALKDIVARTAVPLLDMLPAPHIDRAHRDMGEVFDKAASIAKEKQLSGSLMWALLTSKNEDGSPALTMDAAITEAKTVRGAGHETTSNTLCLMLTLLAPNPAKLAKLQAEVDATVQGRTATYEEAKGMSYAHMVMFETLRLFPTVPSFPREASCDTEVAGYSIPKGALVFVSQWPMNHSEQLWESPEEFRPERFTQLPDLITTKPVGVPGGGDDLKYGFLPFGAGARTCVGARLAMVEGVMILASIVKNFDFELALPPGKELRIRSDVTLGPKKGLPLKVSVR